MKRIEAIHYNIVQHQSTKQTTYKRRKYTTHSIVKHASSQVYKKNTTKQLKISKISSSYVIWPFAMRQI